MTKVAARVASAGPFPVPAKRTVLIAGGGTGGHLMPALAIAAELDARGLTFQPHFWLSAICASCVTFVEWASAEWVCRLRLSMRIAPGVC